jgi:hypothetical protein
MQPHLMPFIAEPEYKNSYQRQLYSTVIAHMIRVITIFSLD